MSIDRKPAAGRFVLTGALDDFFVRDILSMFNFVSDAVAWIKDGEFKYRWANHALLLTFSFVDESEIIGKTDYDFVPVYLIVVGPHLEVGMLEVDTEIDDGDHDVGVTIG